MFNIFRVPAALCILCVATAGCSRNDASLSPAQVCASADTNLRIKRATFDAAAKEASSQTLYALGSLDKQSETRLVDPIVEHYDHDTRKTTCVANLQVWLPAGVMSTREMNGPIGYVSQPTADNRDVVFSVTGIEPLAAKIAGADLGSWAQKNAPPKPGLIVEVVQSDAAPGRPTPLQVASAESSGSAQQAPRFSPGPARVGPRAPPPPPQAERQPSASAPMALGAAPTKRSAVQSAPLAAARIAVASAAPTNSRTDLAPAARPIRVFVHVSDPSQLASANEVRAELASLQIGGAAVGTPPIRLVANMPNRAEVRCLKNADCNAARRVAAYLARDLGSAVAVVDMSATYENDLSVRPGSIEFWLPPGSAH